TPRRPPPLAPSSRRPTGQWRGGGEMSTFGPTFEQNGTYNLLRDAGYEYSLTDEHGWIYMNKYQHIYDAKLLVDSVMIDTEGRTHSNFVATPPVSNKEGNEK